MSPKLVNVKKIDCCPACKGKLGFEYHQHAKVKKSSRWGRNPYKAKQTKVLVPEYRPKTIVCADCGKRFSI